MKKIFLLVLTLGTLFAISGCSSPSGGSPDTDPVTSYTVTFDPNGGSGTMTAQSIASGTTAALTANAFTKAGVSFAGWATTTTGLVSYPDRASYAMGSASVTLYAVWKTSYTVTFDANEGSGTMTAQSIARGATVTLSANTFTKSGLYFAGWSTTKTGSVDYTDGDSYTMGSANAVLFALWTTTPSYKITFDANGGSGTMSDQSIVSGTAANLSANIFTKTGFSFAGWATTKTGLVSYTEGASYPMGTANVTLYAIWTITPSYTVTFDANGGSGSMTAQSIVSRASANLSANTFTNTGYSFAGWSITKTGSVDYTDGDSYTMGDANVTLYAIWEIDNGLRYTLINNGTEYEASCGTYAGTTLTIPESYRGKKVTAIAARGFYQKTKLISMSLPSSITSIGDYAFDGCTEVTGTLTIPSGVTLIGSYAFNNCSKLTGTLTIPSGVTSIGSYAFRNCSKLTGSLTLPSSVISIGKFAFNNCSKLTGSLTVPSSMTSIEEYTFAGCSGLTGSLSIPSGVTSIGNSAFAECYRLTGALTIPSGVTSIGDSAFRGCAGLTDTLTIPSGVTSIGNYVFRGCSGLTGALIIPPSVKSIGEYAFERCTGLNNAVTIPSGVISIGEYAFAECRGLTGSLTIPDSVTSIGRNAFEYCAGLNGTLTIPSNITSIEMYVFAGCSGLTKTLSIPSSVKSIGICAFCGCSGLTGDLTIPSSVTSIGEGAFDGCTGLNGSLKISSNVTSISENAFHSCTGLTGSLVIPAGVTSIGDCAFVDCKKLTGVLTIPSGVTSIGTYAFSGCSGLTGSLTIPSKVKSIGGGAFEDCTGITGSLVIPASVETIARNAFSSFSGTVTVNATTPPWVEDSIFTISQITKIKVPAAEVTAYKTSVYYWSEYASKIVSQ